MFLEAEDTMTINKITNMFEAEVLVFSTLRKFPPGNGDSNRLMMQHCLVVPSPFPVCLVKDTLDILCYLADGQTFPLTVFTP